MKRILIAILTALTLLAGWTPAADAADRTPLLMEGKKTLYQRVITHPGASLYAGQGEGSTVIQKAVRPFSVFYVYTRDGNWLEVGASTTKPDGWIKATDTTAWNQALTMLFTDRSQRQPVLFFKDHKAIMDVCQAEDLPGSLSKLRAEAKAAQQGDAPADLPILAVEPDDAQGAVSRNRFYLMPILKVDTPFEGTKLLEVASIDPGSAGDKPDANAPKDAKDDGVPRTGIAMVIDTTISMKPYIDQSLNVVRAIFDSVAKDKLDDKVSFGIVAFRNSTKASPKLEYVTKVVSDFRDATKRDELEKALSGLEEAKTSSHSFNEDSLAGVKSALDQLNWQPYANRVLLLITDAGPLPLSDANASTSLDVQELADLAASRNIRLVVAHVRTPAGKGNIDYAAKAYTTLSAVPGGKSAYIPIQATDAAKGSTSFAKAATGLSSALVSSVKQSLAGKAPVKPQEAPAQSPEERAKQIGEELGYAMQLEYLGKKQGTRAPEVVTSWIADADLDALSAGKPVSAVSVAVLLTKNQLSDLQRQLKIIIDNAERTRKTDSRDFFQGILSASAQLARDPAAFSQKPGANLRDMGVLGEFLDDLPYKSDIMLLSEDDWYRMSVGEQTAFINRLKSRVARYEEYDRDVSNWESFGSKDPGDWVYRVPLAMLP
ncbi:vWA domain-containing protein [Bilophila wadsworthia]|uniref:vWA domain-containing protein n=2 Tax=Bilophila wadsworthia TaxID=35833 RepID=UPI00243159D2|nr:vWA domain-containing protein [Bilophila wadsworthia]